MIMSKLRIARLEVGGFTCGEFFAAVSLPESVVSTLETKSGISFLAMAQGFGALLSLSSDGKPYVGIPLHVRLLNYDSIRGMFRRLDTHARKAFIERICVNVLCMPLFSTMNDLIWGAIADAARLSLTNKPSPLKLRRTV